MSDPEGDSLAACLPALAGFLRRRPLEPTCRCFRRAYLGAEPVPTSLTPAFTEQAMTQENESFEFTLIRRQLVDADGKAVNEDSDDPSEWDRADAVDANAPPDILYIGRGRMTVISSDERAFVTEHLALDPEPQARYIRAALEMEATEREPSMGDLVAVVLPADTAVLFEVVICWADLELTAEELLVADATTLVSLPLGHAILRRHPDLPVVRTAFDGPGDGAADVTMRGTYAEH
jgi:hypothetical protein